MQREFNSHMECKTWEYRPQSECSLAGREPIDNMWVYDCKVDQTSRKFLLWKARLVGRGDQMVYLRDFSKPTPASCGSRLSVLSSPFVRSMG